MKTSLFKYLLPVVLLTTAVHHAGSAADLLGKPLPETPANDSIFIFKQAIDRSSRILLYPDASQKVVFFSVKGTEGKAYELFLFDLDGRLISQTEVRNRQTTVLKELEKGVYLFDVFSDDVKIANGQMTVR